MLFAAMLSAAVASSPPATPTPEIAHVRTSAYCTAFRDQVLPSVQGLLANDSLVASAQNIDNALRADAGNQSADGSTEDGSLTLDRMHLDLTLQRIVDNLKKFDALFAKLDDQIAHAAPQDRTDLEAMRAQIAAVITQQRAELYLFGGLLSTEQSGDFQTSVNSLRSVTMPDADQRAEQAVYGGAAADTPSDPKVAHVDAASPSQDDRAARRASPAGGASSPPTSMAAARAGVAREESLLAAQITSAASFCSLTKPSPSPSP